MNEDGKRAAIIGKSGYGKSYFTKKKIIPALVKKKPVIIIDPKPDYFGPAARDADPKWSGYMNFPLFAKRLLDDNGLNKEVYILRPRTPAELEAAIITVLRQKTPLSLVIEEAKDLDLSGYKDAYEQVMRIARQGRSMQIDLILVTQRLKDLSPDIRSQLDGIVSFYQDHPDDVKEIQKIDYKAGSKVNDLQQREYVYTQNLPDAIKAVV